MNENLQEKFAEISIWDIAKHWIETYPEDIFITGPFPIPEIRELFKKLLKMKKKG